MTWLRLPAFAATASAAASGFMSGRLKGWRRIAARHDRCARAFFSVVTVAATVSFRLK